MNPINEDFHDETGQKSMQNVVGNEVTHSTEKNTGENSVRPSKTVRNSNTKNNTANFASPEISSSRQNFRSPLQRIKNVMHDLSSPPKFMKSQRSYLFASSNSTMSSYQPNSSSSLKRKSHFKVPVKKHCAEYINMPLHRACYEARTITELYTSILQSYPPCNGSDSLKLSSYRQKNIISLPASQTDSKGRLPLHILSMNGDLARSRLESEEMNNGPSLEQFITDFLLPSCPVAINTKDDNGQIPFEHEIKLWIENSHEKELMEYNQNLETSSNTTTRTLPSRARSVFLAAGVATNAFTSTAKKSVLPARLSSIGTTSNSRSCNNNNGNNIGDDENDSRSDDESTESSNNSIDSFGQDLDSQPHHEQWPDTSTFMMNIAATSRTVNPEETFPRNVSVTPELVYSLQMLSMILELLESRNPFNQESTSKESIPITPITSNLRGPNTLIRKKSFINFTRGSGRKQRFKDVPPPSPTHLEDCPLSLPQSIPETRAEIIERIASIPNVVKTLLLIDSETERTFIFDLPIIKHIVYSPHSIGPWLVKMIQESNRQKHVAQKAVNYLQFLSEDDNCINIDDSDYDRTERCDDDDNLLFTAKTQELYEHIANLNGLIPSMMTLGERMMEEVATTQIISRVLDRMVLKPFAISVVFFDSLFLGVLIATFKTTASYFLKGGVDAETIVQYIYITNACIFYFVIRELAKCISISTLLSRNAFLKRYLVTFWNVVDYLSIAFALTGTSLMRAGLSFHNEDPPYSLLSPESVELRVILALTMGLLWLKVLGVAKWLNVQLATFVLAIVQITRDMMWFLSILLAIIICFSQMFHILLVPENCATTENELCNQGEYYLKVYSILLGDYGEFERSDFTSGVSVFLAVLFTFMVVIVLLNVLIAIVSDSYEKCLLRSEFLFGRARIMLLGELVSFQNLLRSGGDGLDKDNENNRKTCMRWRKESILFFCLSTLICLTWIAAETLAFIYGHDINFKFNMLSIVVNLIVLLIIFFVFVREASSFSITNTFRDSNSGGAAIHYTNDSYCSNFISRMIHQFMLNLLRTSKDKSFKKKQHSEWRGQIHYLESEMMRVSKKTTMNTKEIIREELIHREARLDRELDERFNELENRLRIELEKNFNRIRWVTNESR